MKIEPKEIYNKWKGLESSDGDRILAESYFFFPFEASVYMKNIKDQKFPLISTEIWPSGKCNYKCVFCSTERFSYKRKETLELPELKSIVDDLSKLGNKVVRLSGGGEPFMTKGIESLIEHIGEKGMESSIITNGSIISQRSAEAIANFGTQFRVSFNAGSRKDYERIHGVDTFHKVIKNMKKISELRNRGGNLLLGATLVASPENFQNIYNAAKIVKDCGYDFFLVRATNPRRHHFTGKDKGILASQLDKAHELKDAYFNLSGKLESISGEKRKKEPVDLPCYSTYYRAYISNTGSVYPCFSGIVHEIGEYGNIKKASFKEIWQGETHRNLREELGSGSLLTNCSRFCSYVKFNEFINWAKTKTQQDNMVFRKIPKEWATELIDPRHLEPFQV